MDVLIIGAGAVGTPLGYILSKNKKNRVTYYVRDEKVGSLRGKTFKLFSYDKKALFDFSGFDVLSTSDLKSTTDNKFDKFKVVIVALSGDVLASASGKEIISGLAKKLKQDAVFITLCPGFQMSETVYEPCGVSRKRVVYGLPLFICHEVPFEGQPDSPKYAARKDADLAFHFLVSSGRILLLSNTRYLFKSKALSVASRMLSKAGTGSIRLGQNLLEASTILILGLDLLLDVQNYPKSLKKSDPKKSMTKAVRALGQTFNNYGFLGFIMKVFVGANVIKLTDYFNRLSSKPLTLEFIKYHHGHKVKEQNIQLLENYINFGKKYQRKVNRIEEFVELCRTSGEGK